GADSGSAERVRARRGASDERGVAVVVLADADCVFHQHIAWTLRVGAEAQSDVRDLLLIPAGVVVGAPAAPQDLGRHRCGVVGAADRRDGPVPARLTRYGRRAVS